MTRERRPPQGASRKSSSQQVDGSTRRSLTGQPFVVRWRRAVLEADPVGVPASARLVALVLAEHMNADGGSCYPAVSRIVRETGLGRRTVQRAIARLERDGYLAVERTLGGHRADVDARNRYRPLLPDGRHHDTGNERHGAAGRTAQRASQVPGTGVTVAHDGRHGGAQVAQGVAQGVAKGATSAATPREAVSVPAKRERIPRPRDAIFDALVEACGLDYADMTKAALRACGVAAAELRGLERPPDRDEILRRVERWAELYGDATCTPNAVARHWAQLGARRPADRNAREIAALARSLQVLPGGEP